MKRTSFLLLLIVLLFSCTKQNKVESESTQNSEKNEQNKMVTVEDYNLARYVAGYTSGEIMPTNTIIIRFAENIVKANMLDKIEDRIGFEITPKVSGNLIWDKRNVLIFKPDKIWEQGNSYSITIDINSLISEEVSIKSFTLHFSIARQKLIDFAGDFSERTSKNKITYFGSTKLLFPTTPVLLNKSTTLTIRGKKIKVTWKGADTEFTFLSEPFERLDENLKIDFKIDKTLLKLEEDFFRESSLLSLHDMAVILVKRIHDQENPGIEIQFSDNLSIDQDISDYFYLKPAIDFKLKKIGNKVLLNGEFEFGKKYKVTVKKGIKNKVGLALAKNYDKEIRFNDENPQIVFTKSGCFLPSSNDMKIQFRTMNLKNVQLNIKQVFENNLNFFLQDTNLNSTTTNNNRLSHSFSRTGVRIYYEKLAISNIQNKWLLHELDLSKLIPEGNGGLYIVELFFKREDTNYRGIATEGNDYYTNPLKRGYYYRNGSISKPIILSDIGLTVKKAADKYIVYTTDIISAKPISDCKIELKTYQNQIIDTQKTDSSGKAEFDIAKSGAYFVEASRNKQRSLLKLNEMIWNGSNFDVGGVQYSSKGIRAYTYTERGVYRPGDAVNLSMIFRTKNSTLESNHPIKIELRNPRNQVVQNKVLNDGKDGFYNFRFITNSSDPTGDWKVKINAGGTILYHTIKIETVVAERLQLDLSPKSEKVTFDMKEIEFDFQANYLFGAPAADLRYEVEVEVFNNNSLFRIFKYKMFKFNNPTINFKTIKEKILDEKLDANGFQKFAWKLPKFVNAPTGLIAKIQSTVSESGGRSSTDKAYIKIDPFPAYVGLKNSKESWKKLGELNKFEFILLDTEGKELVGEEVVVRIYSNHYHWWWDYDNENRHFKDNTDTELLQEMRFMSKSKPTIFEFTPAEYGKYFVEVTHIPKNGNGHSTGNFFWGSYWGDPSIEMQDAGIINLISDKQKYNPGDVAKIYFDAPKNSQILVSLEKGDNVIEEYWVKGKGGKETIQILITKEMVPNIYCSVSIIQPHKQTENDRPIRLYSIIPINVFDEKTIQEITLEAPEILRPNEKFECSIQTTDHKKTQFTIVIVDEGLLSLTNFESPSAWSEFYKKQILGVKTYDNYGYIIGANKGDVFKTYSIGGDYLFESAREKRLSPEKSKRFKPVCMFKGPIYTDEDGFAKIEFEMPEYMGAVRIMVVSANGAVYGNVDKTVDVKQDIVLLSTLPRLLAPGDKFTIPVEVFATEDNIGDITVNIKTEGPVNIISSKNQKLTFKKMESKRILFEAEVPIETGTAKIIIETKVRNTIIQNTTDISIRPLSARISRQITKVCAANSTIDFDIPNDGISGTNEAILSISRLPKVDITKRINWLIRYPYGCLEQTTSAIFPQLYLREFIKTQDYTDEKITNNINKGISRLKKFQLSDGGFSYWPGEDDVSLWSSNYAGHFLLAAKEAGYFVPQEMINNWSRYLKREVKSYSFNKSYYSKLRTQLYGLYLLAKAKKPEIGAMNYIRENHLKKLNDTERWLLAATYLEAGMKMAAQDIAQTTGIVVQDYTEMSETFGSQIRDKAIILDAMIALGEEEKSLQLYLNLSEQISQQHWYSTQSTAYVLLALGRYIQEHEDNDSDKPITGIVTENNQKAKNISTKKVVTNVALNHSFGKKATFKSTTNTKQLFVTMNWSGIPIKSEDGDSFEGLKIKNVWKDQNGKIITPDKTKQGDVFTQLITITNISNINLDNLALVQLLPSGWEIENERIDSGSNSVGGKHKKFDYSDNQRGIDYVDIRDDRKMWFLNLQKNRSITVEMKLRAVTVGEFFMPATYIDAMYNDKYKARKVGRDVKIYAR